MSMHLNKIKTLIRSGRLIEAADRLASVCEKERDNDEAWFLRGTVLGNLGTFPQAADCLRLAVKLNPRHALSHFNLGNTLAACGQLAEAAAAYQAAQALAPGQTDVARALARVEVKRGRPDRAAEQYRRYLKTHPGDPEALGNLGACCFHLGELEAAATHYREALKRRADPGWLDGLGATLCRQGRISEALEVHREAIRLSPGHAALRSNLLLTLNYLPNITPEEALQEHRRWEQYGNTPSRGLNRFRNTVDPKRRLRIGYVSPDFRVHSVAYFLESLIANHEATEVEIYAYSCSGQRDETTDRLHAWTHHWRDISGLDDSAAFATIQTDTIDILVDLAGHTGGNRLPLFRKRPAPVQVTYLGYPATTGLEAMDYRLTDALADPPGYEPHYREKLIRLPGCFLCYRPPVHSPPIAPGPVAKNGYITFGSFNNQAKINEDVIAVWSNLLHAVPTARLLIKNPSLSDLATRELCRARFAEHGMGGERLELIGLAATTEAHLATYHAVDIALDTFPYNGTTTTCEAIWMGVPVISLAGRAHAGRVGVTVLTALGLEAYVADTRDEYVRKAQELASGGQKLAGLRDSLRATMRNSDLCDDRTFAQRVEEAYRTMWRRWCARQGHV
jgi:protein O-GlcNAc transferase